jgi:YD repeat-containing protein
LSKVTLPEGNYTQMTYDGRGNITELRKVAKAGSGLADIVYTASFPASCTNALTCNKPTSTTDPLNNTTSYTYSTTTGAVTRITRPADIHGVVPETRFVYADRYGRYKNSSGALVTASTPVSILYQSKSCREGSGPTCYDTANDAITQYGYTTGTDASNVELVAVSRKAGDGSLLGKTDYAYDERGRVVSVDGPGSGTVDVTRYIYDDVDQLTGVIGADPDGSAGPLPLPATKIAYNADGEVTTQETGYTYGTADDTLAAFVPKQKVTNAYDTTTGRLIRTTATDGAGTITTAVREFEYDAAGRLVCAADRMNMSISHTTVSACNLETTGAYGEDRIVKTNYNVADQVTSVQSGYGTSKVQTTATYAYSNNGLRTDLTDARGYRTNYVYDGFDRLKTTYYPSPTTTGSFNTSDYQQLTYDAGDRVTTYRTREGKLITFTYDDLGQMLTKVVPGRTGLAATHTRDVYYDYDLHGNMIAARFDSVTGEGLTFAYDALDHLTSTSNSMDSTTRTLSYKYDARDRMTRLTYPDSNQFSYGYDHLNRLNTISRTSDGHTFSTISYNALGAMAGNVRPSTALDQSWLYDNAGRLGSYSIANGSSSKDVSWTYGANAAGQVPIEVRNNDSYAFGSFANTTRSHTANGLNQYTAVAGTSYSYDAMGNLASDGTTTFTYDIENRLVGTSASGSPTVTVRYDPLGRLYEIKSNTTVNSRFLYSGDALVSSSTARRSPGATCASSTPTCAARSSWIPPTTVPIPRSTPMMSTAFPARPTRAGSSTPARPGLRSSGSTITRHACTRPSSAGSCRPIPSAMPTR